MSFLFGGGRPQPSSAEKIAAAEAEIEMVSGMFNQYVFTANSYRSRTMRARNFSTLTLKLSPPGSSTLAPRSASLPNTAKPTSTRANPSASTAA